MLVALFALASLPHPGTRPLADSLVEIVGSWHDAGEFDGLALVADAGEVVCRVAVGPADRSWETPLDVNACFPIASLTKQFTAVLVLQAVERGELALETTLGELLPELASERARGVQIAHLLLHSGGFTDPPLAHYLDLSRTLLTDLEITREFLMDQQPDFEPGTQFRYSNADYHWLGAALELATGEPFRILFEERIAAPLEFTGTGIANRAAVREKRPRDYVRQEGVGWIHPPAYQWSNWQAAGGLESNLTDLHRWNQALVRNELLSAEMTERMLTVPKLPGSHVAFGSWSYSRALPGTDVTLRLAERRGAIGGFAVLNAFDREHEQWVILLSNHGNTTLDTLSYAPCLPLDLFTALHQGQ